MLHACSLFGTPCLEGSELGKLQDALAQVMGDSTGKVQGSPVRQAALGGLGAKEDRTALVTTEQARCLLACRVMGNSMQGRASHSP